MSGFWVGAIQTQEIQRKHGGSGHKLPKICAASLADRQRPSSRSLVPTTALGGHQLSLITPAFLALLLAEQCLKTCSYLQPQKEPGI